MPNRKSDTQPRRLRCACAGIAAWSPDIAMAMPQIMPLTTSTTAAWKLRDEAFIIVFLVRSEGGHRRQIKSRGEPLIVTSGHRDSGDTGRSPHRFDAKKAPLNGACRRRGRRLPDPPGGRRPGSSAAERDARQ